MAITKQVEESLNEAQGNLRNALHWAAKNERPMVCSVIADMIQKIDSVIYTDSMMDKFENRKPGDSGFFGYTFEDE